MVYDGAVYVMGGPGFGNRSLCDAPGGTKIPGMILVDGDDSRQCVMSDSTPQVDAIQGGSTIGGVAVALLEVMEG